MNTKIRIRIDCRIPSIKKDNQPDITKLDKNIKFDIYFGDSDDEIYELLSLDEIVMLRNNIEKALIPIILSVK